SQNPEGNHIAVCALGTNGQSAVCVGFLNSLVGAWRSGGRSLVETAQPKPGVWHHLAYTYDGRMHCLYVDGQLKASTRAPSDTGAPIESGIGGLVYHTEFFPGKLSDIRIYSRTLTAEEVQ